MSLVERIKHFVKKKITIAELERKQEFPMDKSESGIAQFPG